MNPFTLAGIGCMVKAMYCAKQCDRLVVPQILTKRLFTVGYDNGITPGSSVNDCGERANFVRFSDGFTVLGWQVNGVEVGQGSALGPFADWTSQLTGWADFFNIHDLNETSIAAFGQKPAPTWRYAEITGCDPRAVYGPLRLQRDSDGCLFTVYPVQSLASDTTETFLRYSTVDCEDNKSTVWCDCEGNPVDAPDDVKCFVDIGFNFQSYIDLGEAPDCVQIIKDLCDQVDGVGPIPFVLVITDCDGVRTRERWTADSYANAAAPDDLVAYTVVGSVVNCANGEAYVEPPVGRPESNHLIEGCVTVDGEKQSAFVIVDQAGNPLFQPKLLSDIGLEDCC